MAISQTLRTVTEIYNKSGLGDADSGTTYFFDMKDDDVGVVQFRKLAGTGTFLIQGRMADGMPWVDLQETAPSDDNIEVNVPLMPQIRARVLTASGLQVKCWVME